MTSDVCKKKSLGNAHEEASARRPPLWGLLWMNRNSGHRPYPFFAVPDYDFFDKCLGSTVNNGSICPTWTMVYTHSYSTLNSRLNAGIHVVAEFCLCAWVPATMAARRLWIVVSFSINGVHCLFGINSFAPPLLLRNLSLFRINLRVSRVGFAGCPQGMTDTRNRGWRSICGTQGGDNYDLFQLTSNHDFTSSLAILYFPEKAF